MKQLAMGNDSQSRADSTASDPLSAEQLFPLVYAELRRLAAGMLVFEQPGQTLQATALVNEAYLRLVGSASDDGAAAISGPAHGTLMNRAHFFAAASEAMRRILVEAARRRDSLKRGGELARHDVDELDIPLKQPPAEVIAVSEALDKLTKLDARAAELVKLRYFAGFTLKEAAELLQIAPRSADAVWAYAKAWLAAEIGV